MEKKYYLIYKTTNNINGKFYIGAHSTKNVNDRYLGSGSGLLEAIKKHGRKNFTKEILFIFDNEKEMWEKETEIVNLELISNRNIYNRIIGGKCSKKISSFKKKESVFKDKFGKTFRTTTTDPEYINGNITHMNTKGNTCLIDPVTGKCGFFPVPLSNKLKALGWHHPTAGYCRYKDSCNNQYYFKTDDPKIKELGLIMWSTNKKVMKLKNNEHEIIWIDSDKVTDDMISISKNFVSVKDANGKYLKVKNNDENYINGNFVGVNKGRTGLFDHINKNLKKCVHCGIKTTSGNISRWHNDKCKKNT